MLNAATQVLFEGVPTHPDAGRAWDIVDKYKVSRAQPHAPRACAHEHAWERGSMCQCRMLCMAAPVTACSGLDVKGASVCLP